MSEYWYNRLQRASELDNSQCDDVSQYYDTIDGYDREIMGIEQLIQHAYDYYDNKSIELDNSILLSDHEKVIYIRGGTGGKTKYTFWVYDPVLEWKRKLTDFECEWLGFSLVYGTKRMSDDFPIINIGTSQYKPILDAFNNSKDYFRNEQNNTINHLRGLQNDLRINIKEIYEQIKSIKNEQKQSKKGMWWRVYEQYGQSDEWKQKRAQVYERDGWTCQKCGAGHKAILQAHHITYFNVGDEPLRDLITLCKLCHDREHGRAI
jgi:5-methylcytosine-specific restriction endonuclease McrA